MRVEFLRKFNKDISSLKVKSIKLKLIETIELIESANSIGTICSSQGYLQPVSLM
jgi:hypothetical protein